MCLSACLSVCLSVCLPVCVSKLIRKLDIFWWNKQISLKSSGPGQLCTGVSDQPASRVWPWANNSLFLVSSPWVFVPTGFWHTFLETPGLGLKNRESIFDFWVGPNILGFEWVCTWGFLEFGLFIKYPYYQILWTFYVICNVLSPPGVSGDPPMWESLNIFIK